MKTFVMFFLVHTENQYVVYHAYYAVSALQYTRHFLLEMFRRRCYYEWQTVETVSTKRSYERRQ